MAEKPDDSNIGGNRRDAPKKLTRQERLAAALRANLRRRKAGTGPGPGASQAAPADQPRALKKDDG